MSRLIDENDIIKMLNTMDRYTSEELTLCDTDETFPKNEVFIVDDVFEGLDELPSAQPDLSGYSDRLWKAAYERGKAEAQRTGKWKRVSADKYVPSASYVYRCDRCIETSWYASEYCPHCGARMKGG